LISVWVALDEGSRACSSGGALDRLLIHKVSYVAKRNVLGNSICIFREILEDNAEKISVVLHAKVAYINTVEAYRSTDRIVQPSQKLD